MEKLNTQNNWESLGEPVQLENGKRVEYSCLHKNEEYIARAMLIGKDFGKDYIVRTECLENVIIDDITIFAQLNKKLGVYPQVAA